MRVVRMFLADSEGLPWNETPFPGISEKILKIGDDVGNRALGVIDLTRITEGYSLPPHRHLVAQQSYFLEGLGQALDGTMIKAGSYAEVPPGVRHGTKAVEGDVVILNFFDGMVTWVLDDGNVFALRSDGSFAALGKMEPLGNKDLF
jgi:mannose-6-phosphate isomerase-like protein (cupin superfamily)